MKKNPDQNPTGVCLGRFNLYPTQVELRSNVQTVGNVERGIVKKEESKLLNYNDYQPTLDGFDLCCELQKRKV